MAIFDDVLGLAIVIAIGIAFYNKYKGQTVKDTIQEVKETIGGNENE